MDFVCNETVTFSPLLVYSSSICIRDAQERNQISEDKREKKSGLPPPASEEEQAAATAAASEAAP